MNDFRISIINEGLQPPENIPFEKLIRFPGEGKSYKSRAAWCYLFAEGKFGVFGDFSSGLFIRWQADKNIKYDQLINFKKIQEEIKKKQKIEHDKVAKKVRKEISGMVDAKEHDYLTNKKVKPYGLKIKDNFLVMPLYDSNGEITTYQRIYPDGDKKLFYGGKKEGCAFPIPGNNDVVYITEGYSTGASVREATGNMVIVTCDAGNIENVVSLARDKDYKKIVIAADNDKAGIKFAKKTCEKYPDIKYIVPPIDGYDWNDYCSEKGIDKTKELITDLNSSYKKLTADDIKLETKTTQIPTSLYNEGLLKLGMEAVKELSAIGIVQYNFPSILSLISSVLAGKIQHRNIHPSCFFIRVGGTSTGKTDTDKALKNLTIPYFNTTIANKNGHKETINTLYGPTGFASGPALFKTVQKKPRCLITIDEITDMFSGGGDPVSSGKRSVILELSTAAGQQIEKSYADSNKNIIINNSCINLIGNATPLIFDSFCLDDLLSGLIQRLDFFCYDGPIPYRDSYPNPDSKIGKQFVDKLVSITQVEKPTGQYDLLTDSAIDIGISEEAQKKSNEYSRQIVDECNAEDNEGIKGIISRKYNASIKFALIHAGATREPNDIFRSLDCSNIRYGEKLANLLSAWKINVLTNNIHAGEFDNYVNLFVIAAKSSIKAGKKPTAKMIVNRQPRLKNLKPRDFDDVIKICCARKFIQIREDRGRTLYEPIRYADEIE